MNTTLLRKFINRRLLYSTLHALWLSACFYNTASAQAEDNIWVFGTDAALDLNSGIPMSLSGFTTYSGEGSASVSDASGNILFYSDSNRVRNKLDAVMPNGAGLAIQDPETSTQGMAICQLPGSDSLYYLFTIDAQGAATGYLRYNIIDMSLDGGNGDIIPTGKNIILDSFVHEKMTIVRDAGCYYWLVTYSDINMEFHSFRITETGFEPAVISSSTIPSTAIGELKISPDGTKLAMATYLSYVELADFNRSTGVVSGFMTTNLSPNLAPFATTYGCSFSAGSNMLYVSSNDKIFQYDLGGWPSSFLIASSAYMFPFTAPYPQLRLASNGKIYLPDAPVNISVINNPDLPGPACNPVPSIMPVGGGASLLFGLGTSIVTNSKPTVVAGSVYDSIVCYVDSMVLDPSPGRDVYIWDDGSAGQTRTIYSSGTYWVRYGTSCDQTVDTFHITIIGDDIYIHNEDPTTACWGELIDLVADDVPGYTYEGSPASYIADPASPVTTMNATNGTVTLKVSYPGCPDFYRFFRIFAIDCFPIEPIAGTIPFGNMQKKTAVGEPDPGDFNITAYPNPTYDYVTIKIEGYRGTAAVITICDLLGRTLKTQKVTGRETRINMSNLSPGMYLIKYTDNPRAKTVIIKK